MTNKPSLVNNPDSGLVHDLMGRVKLILRLIGDKRVNFFLKLLPIGAAIYVVSPVDFIPGLALPVIGVLDDAAVLWLGTTLFVSLCPEEVVREHSADLEGVVQAEWRDAEGQAGSEIVKVDSDEPKPVPPSG